MRRFNGLLSGAIVVLLGVAAAWAQPVAIAQEATPAGEGMMPEGITFEPAAFAFGVELASPADLYVVRVGLEPGAGFPIMDSDPSSGILVVESGTITVEIDGPMQVTRGAGLATAGATGDFSAAMESIAPGEVVTLEAGDATYFGGGINGEVRNDGEEPAVGLGFLIGPTGGMMGEATPGP